jgi:hypothetical protein
VAWRNFVRQEGGLFCFNSCDDNLPAETIDDLVVSLGMGNRWHWDVFNLGITWVNWGPDVARLSDSGDRTLGTGELRLLNLDLGVSF